MNYQIAYITHFHSLDDTFWEIEIFINDYKGSPSEISLDGDEPCVIEWQETGKMDVVQSSICTLRVSNEKDRQMVQLLTDRDAIVLVMRNNMPYWIGRLDDSVYEEPYSYTTAYVTELVFSDFGSLNRFSFDLSGKKKVSTIVSDCIHSAIPCGYPVNLYTSLLDPNTQQPITLDMLYINAGRFRSDGDSWGKKTTKREVLEEVLRPLGLHIMQKNGQIYIYDLESLRDDDTKHNYPVWKGTDAYLRGSETFGWYEVAFEPDAQKTLAETKLNFDTTLDDRYWVLYIDEETEERAKGYYINLGIYSKLNRKCREFKTRPVVSSSDDIGYAWRVWCQDDLATSPHYLLYNELVFDIFDIPSNPRPFAEALFKIETGYLPLCPDAADYQMRVNLDLLLSPKRNPMEADAKWNWPQGTSGNVTQKGWKEGLLQIYVPVKLELLDEQGNVLMHYKNTFAVNQDFYPLGIDRGKWKAGEAYFGDMMLAYYNDGLDETALDGWATNRQTMSIDKKRIPSLYKNIEDGEYVPLPPVAGIVRLTVSNCVYPLKQLERQRLYEFEAYIKWHLLRNAKITMVKAKNTYDEIDTDTVFFRNCENTEDDIINETEKAGSWCKGVAPSARGLLFRENGNVWEKFVKDGRLATLQEHRLKFLYEQTIASQPVISGTAELDTGFCSYKEYSTQGVFFVTSCRQNLHQDTQEVTMARIAPKGLKTFYTFAWSNSYCSEEPEPYYFAWIAPICAKVTGPYSFAWSNGICATQHVYILEWEELQSITD